MGSYPPAMVRADSRLRSLRLASRDHAEPFSGWLFSGTLGMRVDDVPIRSRLELDLQRRIDSS